MRTMMIAAAAALLAVPASGQTDRETVVATFNAASDAFGAEADRLRALSQEQHALVTRECAPRGNVHACLAAINWMNAASVRSNVATVLQRHAQAQGVAANYQASMLNLMIDVLTTLDRIEARLDDLERGQ